MRLVPFLASSVPYLEGDTLLLPIDFVSDFNSFGVEVSAYCWFVDLRNSFAYIVLDKTSFADSTIPQHDYLENVVFLTDT